MFKTKDKKTLMDVSGLFDESRISAVKLHRVKVAHMPGKTCLQKLHFKKTYSNYLQNVWGKFFVFCF